MTKALLLVATLRIVLLSCSAAGAAAEAEGKIVDQYATTESTGETLVHRALSLMNPATHQMELMTQVLRKSEDGSFMVVYPMMSANLKRRHELLCATRGGEDVSDQGMTFISAETIDAFSCSTPEAKTAHDRH